MASKVYSFLDVQAAIAGPGGVFNIGNGSGAAEEGISISPTSEINTMMVGADGSGQHSLHADKSGRIIVRLLKTSPTNGQLMAMYNIQTASAAAHGQNTITINDVNRGEVITARQVAFGKAPDLSYGKAAGVNEWEFHAVAIDRGLAID
jgi:hypothetical protein